MTKVVGLLLFALALSLPGDEPSKRWEYLIVSSCNFEPLVASCMAGGGANPKFRRLNEIGSEGWELAAAFPNGTAIFKRPK